MISVVLCKVSQLSLKKRKSYADRKFFTAKCSIINDGATLTNNQVQQLNMFSA